MKHLILYVFLCAFGSAIHCQEIPDMAEEQLEELTDNQQAETEDDTYLLDLDHYRRHPLNLNAADESDLRALHVLNDLQIMSLLAYRKLLGNLVSIYELQAVPGWDTPMIRKLLPFITVGTPVSAKEDLGKRLQEGEHSLLFRVTQVLERSKGFGDSAAYMGSPQHIYTRYKYNYKNLLQFGMLGDKDAGEPFLKNVQRAGFDFYSFHLFMRKSGIIEALALGDFTVNIGQGLIQWQGQAFGKSAATMNIKRQSVVLRPYSSAGEYNFERGAGITIRKGNLETTIFASLRKVSAHLEMEGTPVISSFLASGLNRTATEIGNRNNTRQLSSGLAVAYRTYKWHAAINAIGYKFSLPVQKRDEPYNLFAIDGDQWYNLSVDYSYMYRNVHAFGEAAIDKKLNSAFINGVMVSLDPRIDLSLLQRTIGRGYQAVNGNAFTENTAPGNETGCYIGMTIRPADNSKIDTYADIYKFSWLKYLVDAPSAGRDFFIQFTYTINKKAEIYTLFKNKRKQGNQPDNTTPANFLVQMPKQNWRIHFSYKINASFTWRSRAEMCWYDKRGNNASRGFLFYADMLYKPMQKKYSLVGRLQYFETDDYNSRMYAYENDVLYSSAVPVFSDKGYRYYMVFNLDIYKKLTCGLRLAQTIYGNKNSIGSGLDEIAGNSKTELKIQLRYLW